MGERRKLAVAAAALAVLAALALPVAALADSETPTGAGAAQQVKKDEGGAAQQPKGATGAVATQSKPLSDHVGEGLVAANIYFVASADDFGRAVRDAPHGVCVLCVRVCCLSVLCARVCVCSAHAGVHRCMHADATPTQTHARAHTHKRSCSSTAGGASSTSAGRRRGRRWTSWPRVCKRLSRACTVEAARRARPPSCRTTTRWGARSEQPIAHMLPPSRCSQMRPRGA